MATLLPNVPCASPMTDENGRLTEAWSKFFLQLTQRAGGPSALSNTELATLHSADLTALEAEVTALTTEVASLSSQISSGSNAITNGRQL